MIITCASCLTKFHLDDNRIPPKGAKVRCSRCRHVFHVLPIQETNKEVGAGDDFEGLKGYGRKEATFPLPIEEEEEMEEPILPQKTMPAETGRNGRVEKKEEKRGKAFTAKRVVRAERKGPSLFFILVAIVVLLVLVALYLLSELGAGGKFLPYLQSLIQEITKYWHQIF